MGRSAKYIVAFAAAVCLVCSILVSGAAVSLKPLQEINKTLDKQKKVLTVAGLMSHGEEILPEEVQRRFTESIEAVVIDLSTGMADEEADVGRFDQKKATGDPETSIVAPKNRAGVGRMPKQAMVYLVKKADAVEMFILPIEGKGLWSTLYGFIALGPDTNRIEGITFYQHGETPGLGGEVDNPSWKAKWPGRLAFGASKAPADWDKPRIRVIKGSAGSVSDAPHSVDGLAGATITSNGVTHLLHLWLGENGFGPYLKKQRPRGDGAAARTGGDA
jgi:Na+-transporting NADH:ubiquinone oxidoreductase subunit C